MTQDAFLSAYRAYDRFRGQSHVTTWLYRITMNAALMRLRKTKKDRTLTNTGVDDMEVVDWTKNPHKDALDSELGDKLREGIDLLEPDLRAALVLRDVQGLSNAEAAEASTSPSRLSSRACTARAWSCGDTSKSTSGRRGRSGTYAAGVKLVLRQAQLTGVEPE